MKLRLVLPACALAALALTGCVSNDASTSSATVAVSSTADACTLDTSTVAAGSVTFTITNDGDDVTEFYLYGADGSTIVGEREDIGPGTSRDLTVTVEAGTYVAACKPGMAGDGIRETLTVTS